MMPQFVQDLGHPSEDWVEKHDVLVDASKNQLTNQNAKVWFLTNHKIRKGLKDLEAKVSESLSNNKKCLSASFRTLTRLTGVTNKTLTKSLRSHWIESELARIEKLKFKKEETALNKEQRYLSRIEQLELSETKLIGQLLDSVNALRAKDIRIQSLENKVVLLTNKLYEK